MCSWDTQALLPPQVVQSLLSKLGGPGQFGGVSVDIYDELLGYVVTYLHEVTNDFYQVSLNERGIRSAMLKPVMLGV